MDLNLLLRGQSNALLFADTGGAQALADKLEAATGHNIHLLASYGSGSDHSIFSGTEFLTQWMNGTQAGPLEQGLLNYIQGQSADIKDNPTLELWMHNESDQKMSGGFSGDYWKTVYEANHDMVEQAFGHSVTTEFVPIRYNWGNIGPILDGMKAAVADGTAAGIDMSAYDLAKMDWGGTPDTEHMCANDAHVIADALAKDLAPLVKAMAEGAGVPSQPANPATPPPGPVALEAGTGPDSLVLKISQDAYQGSAECTVSVDGKQVGGTFTASAWHSAGQSDTLTLKGDWGPGEHQMSVAFLNDAYGGTAATDRNLHLDAASYNNRAVDGAAGALMSAGAKGFAFTESAAPAQPQQPVGTLDLTAGTGPDALVLKISQDAYEGPAQYTVSVDGKRIGEIFTAGAWHAAGQSDTLTLKGDWAPGAHQVSVEFLNDRWDGTAATDRNLYVDSASYNGQAVTGAAKALMSDGAEGFAFTEAPPPVPVPQQPVGTSNLSAGGGPDSLVLKLSQDAYQGDAQYTVSVDGKQIGGTFTASAAASHAAGRSDTLTVKGDWGPGEHKVEVTFLNDAYGGTAAADRNLHLDSASYNGQAVTGAAATLWDAGAASFAFTDKAAAPAPVVQVGTDGADLFDAEAAGGVFTGKGGRDLFVFEAGDGHAVITDFASRTDKLVFVDLDAADVAMAKATEGGVSGLMVSYGEGGTVFLAGVSALAARDWAFG